MSRAGSACIWPPVDLLRGEHPQDCRVASSLFLESCGANQLRRSEIALTYATNHLLYNALRHTTNHLTRLSVQCEPPASCKPAGSARGGEPSRCCSSRQLPTRRATTASRSCRSGERLGSLRLRVELSSTDGRRLSRKPSPRGVEFLRFGESARRRRGVGEAKTRGRVLDAGGKRRSKGWIPTYTHSERVERRMAMAPVGSCFEGRGPATPQVTSGFAPPVRAAAAPKDTTAGRTELLARGERERLLGARLSCSEEFELFRRGLALRSEFPCTPLLSARSSRCP